MNNFFTPSDPLNEIIRETMEDKTVLKTEHILTGWTNIVIEVTTDKGAYFFRFPRNPFWSKMIVKDAKPWCIMSSYNMINGYRASECAELLTDILRGEWGFDGVVTTDWWNFAQQYKEIKAQNDIKMGCGYPEHIMEALQAGVLTREEMNICAKRILELILKID